MVPYEARPQVKLSWSKAYMRFLLSSDESLMLKIAPLAMLGILPFDIISNIVPLLGELDDLGYLIALAFIIVKTADRVRRYR